MGARQSSPWNSLSALVSLRKDWSVEDRGYASRLSCGYLSVIAKATKTRKAGHERAIYSPVFMLVCKVNLLKNAPVGGFENGAHCWIRTNDPIGVNDVLYH